MELRPKLRVTIAALAAALLVACGGGSNDGADAPTGTPANAVPSPAVSSSAPAVATQSTASTLTPAPRTTPVVLKPSIEEALSCRVPPLRTATGPANQPLQGQDVDTARFPGATCNDGSPAVLNFRPYEGEGNRNKWLIALNGGGSCSGAQNCADRWCGVGTNFDADNMSSKNSGNGLGEGGIFFRNESNPFANWNQVQVRYCSSDLWAGTALAVNFTALDPKTGKEVKYQISFGGENIYEAVVATLRRDGVQALVYTRNSRRTELPDLDDATEVVFAGGSGGGLGVVYNLDRLAETLRAGKSQPPVVRGLIDSALGPDPSKLGYAAFSACVSSNLCTYEALYRAIAANAQNVLKRVTDQSCLDWHLKNQPGSEWQCADPYHVVTNHVSTPFFVRQGLSDNLLSSTDIENGVTTADGKPLTKLSWGVAAREALLALQQAAITGHEGASVTRAPGIFAPSCSEHYTIFANDTTYDVKTQAGGKDYTLFAAWNAWIANQKPDAVISADPRTDKCAGP